MKVAGAVRRFCVENVVPAIAGAAVALAIYRLLLPQLPDDSSFREKLTERGFMPPMCMWLLWWQLSHLVLHYLLRIRPDLELLGTDIVPKGDDRLRREDIDGLESRVAELRTHSEGSRLARRALLCLELQRQGLSLGEARDSLAKHAETERARAESAYALPRLLVWAIPIFGFIGTVLGIGLAVGELKRALKVTTGETAITESLGHVAANLSVAWDTTHVALLMSILALAAMTVVKRIEDGVLADIDDYVSMRLLSRLRFESPVEKLSNEVRALCSRLDEMLRRS